MVTVPDLDLKAILAEIMSIFFNVFSPTLLLCHARNPDTTDNRGRAVLGTCYKPTGYNIYTPAARHQSRKQHHACAVVCPCRAVASYEYNTVVVFFIELCHLQS